MVEGAALEKRCGVKATGSSNLPLSAIEKTASKGSFFYGTLGAIRTHDLWLRKPTLYPAELRVHTQLHNFITNYHCKQSYRRNFASKRSIASGARSFMGKREASMSTNGSPISSGK